MSPSFTASRLPRCLPLRLHPGDDLRRVLEAVPSAHGVAAAFVLAGIGSLSRTQLRLAGADAATAVQGDVELLSLSGSLGVHGAHLHMSVADAQGRVLGGHVLPGCTVRTTAEVLVLLLPDWQLARGLDPATGYPELQVTRRG